MTQDLSARSNAELLKLAEVPIYRDRHFVYSGDDHGPDYVQLRVLQEPHNSMVMAEFAYRLLANELKAGTLTLQKPLVVLGPETLGQKLAKAAVEEYIQRHGPQPNLRYGYFEAYTVGKEKHYRWGEGGGANLIQPKTEVAPAQVLWLDDLMNSASTWERTQHLVHDFWPGAIKVVAVIVNRSEQTAESLKVPHFSYLQEVSAERFSDPCPLCTQRFPIVRHPGHGHKFEEAHPDYPGGYIDL